MVEPYAGGDGDADETVPEETSPLEESHDPAALHELVSVEANEVGSIKDLEDPVGDETTSNGQDDGTPTTPAELHSTAAISPEKPPMIDDGLKDIATVSAPDNSSHGNQSFLGSNVRQGADVEEKTVLGMADIHRVKEAQGSENTEQTTNLESPHVPPAPVINSSGDESSNEIPDCEPEILEPQVSESSRSDSSTDVERADQSPAVEILEPPPSESPSTRHQTRASPIKRQILEPQQPETDGSITVTDSNPSSGDTIQATNDSAPPAEQPSIPKGRTRSGMRFSDDTTLLKDFLNRARAHKAAKAIPNPSDPTQPLISPLPSPRSVSRRSPRRSPRKALLELDSNSPSPTKSRDVALRPGTPPGKVNRLVGFEEVDAGEEAMTEPMSCRRSARTRLPTPAANKNQIGAPSFIPVIRRGMEGVEQVVLKKSEAQELAMVTRANTRRNKGGAKFPALTLQTLAAETSPGPKGDGKKRAGAKNVNWDGQLLYFQGAYATAGGTGGSKEKDGREQEKEKEKEQGDEREKRPKIRRLKPLGLPVNGTPAPKKTLESESARPAAKGTPAPKKKSRPRPGMGGGDASGPVGAKANNGTPAPAPRRNGKPRP
ncbi:hypothetical protein MMC08_002561 [Hypocenomyce scalaris]|nr:hypothetical protein [Hypocenomyce scalaris]